MKCKHENSYHKTYPPPCGPTFANCMTRRCSRCNELLSLGRSNDGSEAVRLEMRVAELAADWDPDNGRWDGFVSLGMCSPLAEHADLLERDIANGRDRRADLANYIVGHLACCIVSHQPDGEE